MPVNSIFAAVQSESKSSVDLSGSYDNPALRYSFKCQEIIYSDIELEGTIIGEPGV